MAKTKNTVAAKKAKQKFTYAGFKCTLCSKTFTKRAGLNQHLQTHSTDRPFSCDLCPYTCKTKKYLTKHVFRVHNGTKEHECNVCGKTFFYQSVLKKHMYIHTDERPYKCTVCGKGFNSGYSLNSHKYIHIDVKPFKCEFCDYACRDSSTLRKHHEMHMGIKKVYQCTKCDKKCSNRSRLKLHVKEVHLEINVKNFKCDDCSKMYKTLKALNNHIKTVHERAYACKCDVCGAQITNKYNMTAHLTSHFNFRPYKCKFKGCTKRFKDKCGLKKHSIIHYPDKQLECEICNKKFSRKSRLRAHKQQHKIKTKCVICDYCGKSFYNKNYLLIHITKKHIDKEEYICDKCGLRAHNRSSIIRHIRCHDVDEDRQCKICKKVYKKHTYLKQHYLNTHSIRYKLTRRRPKERKSHVVIKEEPKDYTEIELLHEVKVEPLNDQVESMEYSKSTVNNEHTAEDFGDFYTKTIIKPGKDYVDPFKAQPEDDTYDIDLKCQKEFKKCMKKTLDDIRRKKELRYLEKIRREYNKRMRSVNLSRTIDKPKIKFIKVNNNTNDRINKDSKNVISEVVDAIYDTSDDEYLIDKNQNPNKNLKENDNNIGIHNHEEEENTTENNVTTKNERIIFEDENCDEINDDSKETTDDEYLIDKNKSNESLKEYKINSEIQNVGKEEETSRNNLNTRILFEEEIDDDNNESDNECLINNNESDEILTKKGNSENLNDDKNNVNARIIFEDENSDIDIDDDIDEMTDDGWLINRAKESKKNYGILNKKKSEKKKKGLKANNIENVENNENFNPKMGDKNNDEPVSKGYKENEKNSEVINDNQEDKNNDEVVSDVDKNSEKINNSEEVKTIEFDESLINETSKNNNNENNDRKQDSKLKINTHQCYVCFKLYETKEKLINHCQEHFDVCNINMLQKCPLCDFVTKVNLTRHMLTIHKIHLRPYGTLKNTEDGATFYFNVKNKKIKQYEVIPSVKNLNKCASMAIDKKRRDFNYKNLTKRKLVKKNGEWIVERERINAKASKFIIPKIKDIDKLIESSDDYVGRLKKLYQVAKKNGQKMLFPCEKCEKVCQTLSALTLHTRKHAENPKPFKKKVWQHKLTEKEKKTVKEPIKPSKNRYEKPKPIVNKHKCDEKLKEFYENNIRGGDIEFWQFLKIFNRMSRENINDFADLESRTEFGIHYSLPNENSNENENIDTENTNIGTENSNIRSENSKISNENRNKKQAKNSLFKRTILISRNEHRNRKTIIENLRRKNAELPKMKLD